MHTKCLPISNFFFQGPDTSIQYIDAETKEITRNMKYEELFTPVAGPENPFLTQQQKAPKNMMTGFVEKANISDFMFETQRRTFHSFGKLKYE